MTLAQHVCDFGTQQGYERWVRVRGDTLNGVRRPWPSMCAILGPRGYKRLGQGAGYTLDGVEMTLAQHVCDFGSKRILALHMREFLAQVCVGGVRWGCLAQSR